VVLTEEVTPVLQPEKYKWFKCKLPLDLMAMDEELSEISILIHEAGEYAVIASDTADSAKDNLALVQAECAARMRKQTDEKGKGPSETAIASSMPSEPNYIEALNLYNRAKLDAALWRNMQDAFRTKSSSMRVVADLVAAGFISQDHILSKRRAEMRGPANPRTAVKQT